MPSRSFQPAATPQLASTSLANHHLDAQRRLLLSRAPLGGRMVTCKLGDGEWISFQGKRDPCPSEDAPLICRAS